MLLLGEFVISLVLSHRSKNLKPRTNWCYSPMQFPRTHKCYSSLLFRKQRKIYPRGLRAGQPKRCEEKKSPQLNFGSSFYTFFLLPLSLSYVNWASQESCLFYLGSSLWSSDFPLFYFLGLFPSLSFSHCNFGLLFPILTT